MTTPAVPGETGAIHDIGYRRYDGARLGATYIARSLFVHSLRGAYGLGRSAKSKVMPLILLAVMVVPAVIMAAIVIVTGADELPVEYTSYPMSLSVIISVFVAAQSPQLVSRDLRFGVVSLYFSRPLSRQAYVQAKVLAMACAVFVLIALPQLVLYGGALLGKLDFWDQTRDLGAGLVGAALFAVVLGVVGLVVAAFTPRRGLGVAAVIAVLIVLAGVSATVQGIADAQGNDTVAGYAGLISPFSMVDGVQVFALGAESSTVGGPPGTTGGVVFLVATVAVVAACYGLLLVRYRKVSRS